MISNGCPVPTLSHKDFDFHASFGTVGDRPVFPPEFNTDQGVFGFPDQNADGQPRGCTNYSQAALATDLTGKKHDPAQLESVTHANQKGGMQVRDSLDATRKLGWFRWYFNIQAYAPLDWFDAIRYAQLIGSGDREFRSVTLGWPWFPSWERAALNGMSYMHMPTPEELVAVAKDPNSVGWHNWECTGWKPVLGSPMLKCKSWQGTEIGDNGLLYFPREVVNVVMALKYTVAYTPTMLDAPNAFRIPLGILDTIISFIRSFAPSLRY